MKRREEKNFRLYPSEEKAIDKIWREIYNKWFDNGYAELTKEALNSPCQEFMDRTDKELKIQTFATLTYQPHPKIVGANQLRFDWDVVNVDRVFDGMKMHNEISQGVVVRPDGSLEEEKTGKKIAEKVATPFEDGGGIL